MSPYTAVAVEDAFTADWVERPGDVSTLHGRCMYQAEAGKYLVVELRGALAQLRATYPKPKDYDQKLMVGLALVPNGQAHVVDPLDPDATVRVNPRFLVDGLVGAAAPVILWHTGRPYLIVQSLGARYYVALCA